MAKIAAVTVTYNSATVLRPFLACCSAQSHPDFRLIVIDNASRDDTRAILATVTDPRVQVVCNDANVGVAEGNNQGIRIALAEQFDYVLLINNDTEFPPDLFTELEKVLASHTADAVTPRITYFDEQQNDWFADGGFTTFPAGITGRHVTPSPPHRRDVRPIGYAPTCCMLVRTQVFRTVGLMDAEYFVYWDDTDFCWRLRVAGKTLLIAPDVVLAHKVSSLTGGLSSDFFIKYHYRNQMYFVKKHFGFLATWYTAALLAATIVGRIVARGDSLTMCRKRLASLASGLRMSVNSAR